MLQNSKFSIVSIISAGISKKSLHLSLYKNEMIPGNKPKVTMPTTAVRTYELTPQLLVVDPDEIPIGVKSVNV